MVELKKKYLASVKTDKELVVVELDIGDLYLIVIATRVPETNLKEREERERERDILMRW